jgi:putative ABC transport system permease protein
MIKNYFKIALRKLWKHKVFTKEIGVRKVLGASVPDIINLLSKEFLRLVLVAFIIASPVAWIFMSKWLKDFAYRTDLAWWMFVFAGIAAIIIAFGTISFQSNKSSNCKPCEEFEN